MHSNFPIQKFVRQGTGILRTLSVSVFVAIGLCLSGATLHAAELHVTPNQLPVSLGQYLDYFEDPLQEFDIDDMLAAEISWQRSIRDIPTLGISGSAHWFHITLTGEEMLEEDLVLMLDTPALDRAEFYFIQRGQVVRKTVVGTTIPLSAQDYPFRIPVVPFRLNALDEETQIYIRATSALGVEMPLTVTTIGQLALDQQSTIPIFGGILALFTLCFFTCCTLYYFMQEKSFLAYTLFFGGALLLFMALTGLGRIWFWGESPEANSRIVLFSGCILLASLCLIGQCITLDSRHRDSINIVLKFLMYAMVPLSLYYLVIPYQQVSSENVMPLMILALMITVTVLAMAGITALQGSRTATYLFSSWLLIILAYGSFFAYKINLMERASSSMTIGQSLSVGAALLLLMSIAEFIRNKNEEFVEARLETKAKGDFLRNVSREFLTPVHLILANSKRLLAAQSNKLDEATRSHMTTVIKQSDHLHNLINDLLEMAELESDSFEPEFELVDISHFLNEVRDMILPSALEKGLEITTQFASANLLVQTDKSRLQHALLNLLTNAIKYTDKGTIRVGHKAVYFRRRLGIEIFIQDTGRGMSQDFQKRLFQEFSREKDVSEKAPEGTGLGLVIVKRMIEKLGGEIDFQSTKGEGSAFYIRLPLRVTSA